MSADIVKALCVEDLRRHRITAKGSKITVDGKRETPRGLGEWRSNTPAHEHVPLYTRVQPPCPDSGDCDIDAYTDTTRFSGYYFAHSTHLNATQLEKNNLTKLCFLGASHSRTITEILSETVKLVQPDVITHLYAQDPGDLLNRDEPNVYQNAFRQVETANCTDVVLGIGQWPAGWPGGRPLQFDTYESGMRAGLISFVRNIDELNRSVRIYVRNVHENPLGAGPGSCPAGDWRNPEVIRIYNEILAEVCRELKIPFLDTTDIMTPLWDSASDWCHYRDAVGQAEALYLVSLFFSAQKTL